MRNCWQLLAIALVSLGPALTAPGQERQPRPAPQMRFADPADHDQAASDSPDIHGQGTQADHHPVLPGPAKWAGVVVILILGGFFLPAAVIGPIVRALLPEEEPITHSHDEPPGASHHHGHSGTEDPHGHHGGHGH
jgi:hypothetical protein